jgi:ATP-dependent DNA helicase RecQ
MRETYLCKYFGFSSFRPGQAETLDTIEHGRDTIAVLATGSGKSMIYQLFTLYKRRQDPTVACIIVTPLISLMQDQCRLINDQLALDPQTNTVRKRQEGDSDIATYIGTGQNDLSIEEQFCLGRYIFLFMSPEKLQTFQSRLGKRNICLIVIDEVHCVSEYGHDFRPDYRKISSIRQYVKKTPILGLTATANKQCLDDISNVLQMNAHIVQTSMNRSNIFYSVIMKDNERTDILCMSKIISSGSVFIYVPTRKDTVVLLAGFKKHANQYTIATYHAGLDQDIRRDILDRFRCEQVKILICTNAAGMGLNIPCVDTVIHYGMAKSIAAYMQESGRAGRNGQPAKSTMFVGNGDYVTQRLLCRPDQLKILEEMYRFVNWKGCRRSFMLTSMGEEYAGLETKCCDICEGKGIKVEDAVLSPSAIEILCIFGFSSGGIGRKQLLDIIRGKVTKGTIRFQHIPKFGVLKHVTKKEIQTIIKRLIVQTYIEQFINTVQIPLLRITDKGTSCTLRHRSIKRPISIISKLDTFRYIPKNRI